MGFRKKGTLRKFSLDEDMLIIAHMIEVARYKFGRTAIGNWPSIVDCVAAHPEVLSTLAKLLLHNTFCPVIRYH